MTVKSSIPIPPESKYEVPPKTVRERLNSKPLGQFMNYSEIAITARRKADYEQEVMAKRQEERERAYQEKKKLEKDLKIKEMQERAKSLQLASRRLANHNSRNGPLQDDSHPTQPEVVEEKPKKSKKDENRVAFSP